ncbi:MAG: HAD hydrolase-like protein, partial [Chloroflexi bacterium]|nr:HAD hydrolase-like protein [Chloroflexota bacterium]
MEAIEGVPQGLLHGLADAAAAEALDSPEPRLFAGVHCQYCSARHGCKALDEKALSYVDSAHKADRFDLELPPERAGLLPELLPGWLPFSDTVAALARLKKRYRLGILSNVDRDLFAGTARSLGVSFDFVITAEDVRAYKPNPAHFERML